MSDNPATEVLKPVGQTLVELFKLPMDIMKEGLPDLQKQIKDLPATIRENAQFTQKQFRDLPSMLQKGFADASKNTNAPLTVAQAVSPLPILPHEQLLKMQEAMSPKPAATPAK